LTDVATIYSNWYAFAALKNNGTVVAWGNPTFGGASPTGLTDVATIYSNGSVFAALKNDGSVFAWGHTLFGGASPDGLADVGVISYGKQYYNGQYYTHTVPIASLPPVLTITGANPMFIIIDATASYTDLGASAVDADGTNLSSIVEVSGQVVNLAIIGTYTVTYTVTTTDGRSATATRTVIVLPPPTCFPAGTPIQTDQGETAIEQLVPGEHTLRGKSIIAITQTRPLQKHIVCFEKDSIGKNVPSQQTLCSKEHKVLYRGDMIKARDLADMCKNVKKVSYNGETLYNVLLEKHGKMLVNNMICETLHPENIAAKFAKSKNSPGKRIVA
jgi:hypothetical protein